MERFKNRFNILVFMDGQRERWLGGLAVKVADVKKIDTPGQFLSGLSIEVQEAYLQQTIIRELSLDLIPNGD